MLSDDVQRLLRNPLETIREIDKIRCERSLKVFVERYWHILEPSTPLVDGWPLDAICEHLEAVSLGDITRLLINVPPGFMKSLLTDVFWPAWEWTAFGQPNLRYVTFSYTAQLTERDNRRFLDLLRHPDFVADWGNRFALRKQGEVLVSNDKMGWKLATSIGGVGTGERGDRVVLDDPHSVKESESDVVRAETVRWFREAMSNRLNDMSKSAVVVIMQRVHEGDVSGEIISNAHDYEHLMIPMEWDGRRYTTSIGWTDPRETVGELAWPSRFPQAVVDRLKVQMGPYAYASQYQQLPSPRGGGIIKRAWWQLWGNPDNPDDPQFKRFPACEYVVAALDPAYTEKQENDYSALTVWGLFRTEYDLPKIILMHAWHDRLPIHELVERSAMTCRRFKVDRLLVEAKASGISVAQELRRLYLGEAWGVQLVDVKGDKIARAYAVQHIFADEMVYHPDREWAEMVITECEQFPKGAHDDLVDSTTMAIKHLRDIGLAAHGAELAIEVGAPEEYRHGAVSKPLYPA
jgi:predicted phage terminase large subunit-like protein